MQQPGLRVEQAVQAFAHAVEIAAKVGQFVAPSAHRRADAQAEVAFAGGGESPFQAPYRTRHVPGDAGGRREAGEQPADDVQPGDARLARVGKRRWRAVRPGEGWWFAGWAEISRGRQTFGETRFHAAPFRPENRAGGEHRHQLRQPDDQEELPEQAAHGQQAIIW